MQGFSAVESLLSFYRELTGEEFTEQPEDTSDSVPGNTLRRMVEESLRLLKAEEEARKETLNEVSELKSRLVILQSEFDSKFPKNATISLPIPGYLRVKEDDNISIKSFRPEDDDTDETVAKKESERKALKMKEIIAKAKEKSEQTVVKKDEGGRPDSDLSISDEEPD